MPGRFNVSNALVAIACLTSAGVRPSVAVAGVGACPGVPGRLERVSGGAGGVLAVVDYAHKPDAISAVLAVLRPVTAGRVIVVLGCGGDRDRGKRPLMGEAAARGADVVIVTDDNPRTEDPALIRAAAIAGAETVPAAVRARIREIGDRAEAITAAAALAVDGDTIAVLGKGHEPYQEINGVVHDFDDRAVLKTALSMTGSEQDSISAGWLR